MDNKYVPSSQEFQQQRGGKAAKIIGCVCCRVITPLIGLGFLGFAGSLIEDFQAGVHVTELKENSEMGTNRNIDRIKSFLVEFIPLHKEAC